MPLTSTQLDRAVGAVLASAAGDALGSQYEFGPSLPDTTVPEFGVGHFGHEVGEWTDDTSMAIPILQVLADGRTLEDPAALAEIVQAWRVWAQTSKDVGIQTRGILSSLSSTASADDAFAAARLSHERTGRSGGNGSLMRTGPVALGYLDRTPAELAAAAGRVAQLTHWEDDNIVACALWCLAIRHAILTGELDMHAALRSLSEPRSGESKRPDTRTLSERSESQRLAPLTPDAEARWSQLIDEALTPGIHPRAFSEQNGWVVRAFQGALAAVAGATSLVDAVQRAVRGGNDTDTVAAIAGSLAGAVHGAAAVPADWRAQLHGWPGIDADELERLARRAVG